MYFIQVWLMAALSVRLPDDLDRELWEEARRANKRRSELVREAVRDYIQRQVHQRFMDDLVAEMRDWRVHGPPLAIPTS